MAKFYSPIGTLQERESGIVWPASWSDATGWGRQTRPSYVAANDAYHTGADLNLPNFGDSNKPVYAARAGVVRHAKLLSGWPGWTVIVEHEGIWTRYAHLNVPMVREGDVVTHLTQLATIGDYPPAGLTNDHLHFDISNRNLTLTPGDWPKMDWMRLENEYYEPRQYILDHWEDTEVAKWQPTSTDGTRVRLSPSTTSTVNIAGVIPSGAVVDGDLSPDGLWVVVKIKPERMTVSGVLLAQSVNDTFDGYASKTFMKPAVSPPVPPSNNAIGVHPALPALARNKRLGVHTLHRIEEAREAFDLGCRSFTMLNNVTGAREMRSKGAAVIVRRFIDHGVLPDPRGFAAGMGLDGNDTFIVMGTNEADNISTSDIQARFNWDSAFALEAHRLYPRCFIVIGSFSMGTPAIEDANVARLFRQTYGQFLNANAAWCGFNYHNYHRRHAVYLPPSSELVQEPKWWPTRWITWGYDPAYGGLNQNVVMVHDESGVDIGGIGGFPATGYNESTFVQWWNLHDSWFGGLPQIYCHNLFQFSDSQSWAGYNIRVVLGGCAQVWRG